jgi:hypothetical protein
MTSYLVWYSKRVSHLIFTHPSIMISIINQIQASIIGEAKFSSQRRKMSRIKRFSENVSRLPLCINVFHHYVSFLNMVSQEVVSHFYVFCSSVENWVLG